MIKVGADIHGVIDKFPEQFSRWTKELFSHGAEIHIITGQEWDKVVHVVEAADIKYTHHFSIVDYLGAKRKLRCFSIEMNLSKLG